MPRAINLKDEPVRQSNRGGFVSFANENSPQSRHTQVLVNLHHNEDLESQNFPRFGRCRAYSGVCAKMSFLTVSSSDLPNDDVARLRTEFDGFTAWARKTLFEALLQAQTVVCQLKPLPDRRIAQRRRVSRSGRRATDTHPTH